VAAANAERRKGRPQRKHRAVTTTAPPGSPEYQRAWREVNRDVKRGYDQTRRARKKGADAERFLDSEIFERDSYTCYLCGGSVDPALPLFDPCKAVLEHKTPLSRGGTHSRDNVAAACWTCNARKGSMTEGEYREALRAADR